LPLDEALAFLAKNAFTENSEPLFLALELNVHAEPAACDAIAASLRLHFGGRLYTEPLRPDTPLRQLVGRVVVMTGGGVGSDALRSALANADWNHLFLNVPSTVSASALDCSNRVVRVYPEGDIRGALSLNFDPLPYLRQGATFVSLNMCADDEAMKAYMLYFAESSFVAREGIFLGPP
jgi:hypothetical protein